MAENEAKDTTVEAGTAPTEKTPDEAPASTADAPEQPTSESGGDGSLLDRAKEAVQEAAATVTEVATSAVETATDVVEAATETVTEAASSAAASSARVMEEAVEAVSDQLEFPSASEAGVTAEDDEEELTSVENAEAMEHTAGDVGFTGEIVGRVVKLEDLDKEPEEDTFAGYEQLKELIEQTLTDVSEHEIVKGRIVTVGDKDVVIDIGFKSDGIVPKSEFGSDLEAGDEVEVYLERIEDYHGQLILSKTKADTVQRWMKVEDAFENEKVLEGVIVRRIKGGMIVELLDGMEAFLPGSQIDVRPVRDFDAYLEKRMEFKIVKLNPANENIVVSHKALVEKELEAQRDKILSTMEAGQILEGVVKNITDFGVFIDLGGVDGLLHITDLSWGRVSHPSELVDLDQKMNVVVLDYDKDRQRISLGLKQLQSHPWDNIGEKYTVGDTVEGKVVSITDYGAFVELEKGIEGLVHISEMSWTEHIRHPSQMVALGQLVNVRILNIDDEGKKISLGMKQLQPDPWEGISDRYPPGTVMRGRVRNITSFGVFVEVEPGIDGLVHISDLSWTKKVRHPGEMVKKGQDLDVVILNIDEKERRISLGHKQVETNPWNQLTNVYAEGADVNATVSRITEGGLVVELPLDVEGFIPASELANGPRDFEQFYQEGDELEDLRVIRFDANQKEIILSETARSRSEQFEAKQREQRERREERQRERRDVEQFSQTSSSPSASGPATLGELSGLAELKRQMEEAEQAPAETQTSEVDAAEAQTSEVETPEAEPAEAEASAEGTSDAETTEAEATAPETSEADAEEPVITTGKASTDMEDTIGEGNRKPGKAKQESGTTEPPAEQAQRQEEAGEYPPAEKSQAALKGVSEEEAGSLAERAEAATEDETPVTGTSEKPVATVESGQSIGEIESLTEAGEAADEALSDSDEDEATAEAELGTADATVEADSEEEATNVAAQAETEEGEEEASEEAEENKTKKAKKKKS